MDDIEQLEREIYEKKKELAELRKAVQEKVVEDHVLYGPGGQEVRLSELFGQKHDLIVVHNMGRSCPYCTLWADGYNGLTPHLQSRAAFVVVSPDPPEVQAEFAASRGWSFPMYSGDEGGFIEAMGYKSEEGGWAPGVSTFHKAEDGTITRVATAPFGPWDDFCAAWHFFDLLKDGPDGWEAKFDY